MKPTMIIGLTMAAVILVSGCIGNRGHAYPVDSCNVLADPHLHLNRFKSSVDRDETAQVLSEKYWTNVTQKTTQEGWTTVFSVDADCPMSANWTK